MHEPEQENPHEAQTFLGVVFTIYIVVAVAAVLLIWLIFLVPDDWGIQRLTTALAFAIGAAAPFVAGFILTRLARPRRNGWAIFCAVAGVLMANLMAWVGALSAVAPVAS